MKVQHKYVEADGVKIFYREAGVPSNPTVLLLHGFPSSSFQFRDLMPLLADRYYLVAPDLPGFGFTQVPERQSYEYSFANLAKTIEAFTDVLGLNRFALYVFDYGAPTGFRLALSRPEKVMAIISQNGNAYEEGLGDAWQPIQKYWREPTPENRNALRAALTSDAIKQQYTDGVPDPDAVAPESYTLDTALIQRPGNVDIQLDLFGDYADNVKLYPAFQRYFRAKQPPLLAIWGENDGFFIPPGAEAFQRDIPSAIIQLLDTGHFALETNLEDIAEAMQSFLAGVFATT